MKRKLIQLTSSILALVLLFGTLTVFAHETQPTDEDIEILLAHNKLIENYISFMNSKVETGIRTVPKTATLSVPILQQEQTNYCGPASALMVARYLGLVSSTYSQDSMASLIGMSGGVTSGKIVTALNGLIATNNYSYNYEVAYTSVASFSNSIIYSLDNNKPMIFSVKVMPDYTAPSGHFVALKGYIAPVSGSGYSVSQIKINDPHYNNEFYGEHTFSYSDMLYACCTNDKTGNMVGTFIRLSPN